VADQRKKTTRVVFIPDNLPGHVFRADEDEADETAKCTVCGLTLASFLGDPYPRYDRLKLENFRRMKSTWVQLQIRAPVILSNPSNIHSWTENSGWAVYNYQGSRPVHFFVTEKEATQFLNSYSRASFEICRTACQHRIFENADPSKTPQLVLGGTKYSGDGWQNPVPVVSIDAGQHACSQTESLREYFASVGKTRNLDEVDPQAYFSIQVDDTFNGNLEPIKCYLGSDWKFDEIVADASGLRGHQVEDIQITHVYDALKGVARDLDIALWLRPNLLSPLNVASFWTSLQIYRYIENFGQEKMQRTGSQDVDKARTFLHRRLAAYANEIRLALRVGTDAHKVRRGKQGNERTKVRTQDRPVRRLEPHPDPESLFGKRPNQTFRTAAEALGLRHRRLRDLIESGELEAVGVGAARRITTLSLRNYLSAPNKNLQ
jgi:hypothetical protein